MHFNDYGNKEFNNYQRIAIIIIIIILYIRAKKSLRDFSREFKESMWIRWLGLRKVPCKSAIHLWMNLFKMRTIRLLNTLLLKQKKRLTAVDGTGFDSWQRRRHYAKRIGEPNMPYAKADIFVDVESKEILDFSLYENRIADVKAAEKFFRRTKIKGYTILADGAYDSQPLHDIVRDRGAKLYAPVRKSSKNKPRGRWRKKCVNLPSFMGKRSIVETVNYMLKQTQIPTLKSKKKVTKQREFGWNIILHNIKRKILIAEVIENQKTLFFIIVKYQ